MCARSLAAVALLALAAAGGLRAAGQPPAGRPGTPAAPRPAAPEAPPSPIASYTIDARLDPASRSIAGHQVLTWRNPSARPAATLRFHLYYNAWRDPRSTWMRERALAGDTAPGAGSADAWGWIDVTRMRIGREGAGPEEVTDRLRFIAPDDGNTEDRTVLEAPLGSPVQPGETVTVTMAWTSRVPRPFSRTGAIGDAFFVAQWFPKIGVLEDAGWNCRQFHAATEFFADFGNYDVRLTVPAGWIVGATGTLRERTDGADGTSTHRYVQDAVHDFAWTASPDYVESWGVFTHATLPDVRIRLLLQPEHRGQEPRLIDAARAALQHYGEWFGPYPYGHLTIVDPAWQSRAGGMEYPTLVTAGTRWLAPPADSDPEDVIVHEVGHQYWYGLVASNEVDHAWLDEGLTTFCTARIVDRVYGPGHVVRRYFGGFVPWVFRDLRLPRQTATYERGRLRDGGPIDVPSLPTWQYWPRTHATTTYYRTALWLQTLERMVGWEVLQRALSTYFARWAYRHPSPADFFAALGEAAGRDLTWFFDQVHGSAAVFDYGIDAFSSEPVQPGGGSAAAYRTRVVVRRRGDGVFPVDVKVAFENGEDARWRWDGRAGWKQFEIEGPARARRADVDPDRVLLLDVRRTDNSALLRPAGPRAARRWSLVWLIWLQDRLLTRGFFV